MKGVNSTNAALATVTVSLSQILELIPDNIGKLGVLLGCILSLTLIVINIWGARNKQKLYKAQMKKLEREEAS